MDHINFMIPLIAGLFGLCVGSFLNVCIYRIPRDGVSIGWPLFSFCPHCFSTLHWYENLPVFSYFIQKGKCRSCYIWISPRYPFVEILTAAIFAFLAHRFLHWPQISWSLFFIHSLLLCSLLVASFIDLDLRIIPDEIDKPGMVLAPILSYLVPSLHLKKDLVSLPSSFPSFFHTLPAKAALSSLLGILVGSGVILAVGILGKILFQKEAMGFGDVKFMGMIGGFLGWKATLIAFLLACFLGAFVGILKKMVSRDSYIPFGPFLALGAVGMLYWRQPILHLIFYEYPRWLKQLWI
ncbi:MAG: prepilin peptidase [Planctomycetota bacterium]|nr:MAG: prepilin peptidase [Planctomycetota bacterium]